MDRYSHPKFTTGELIQAAKDTKGLITLIARKLGCNPMTVRNYAARHPTVARAIKEEREALVDVAELALYDQVMAREAWAVQFALKTLGKDRGYTERQELAGPEGKGLTFTLRLANDDDSG